MYKVFFQFAGIVSFAFAVVLLFDLVFFGVGRLLTISLGLDCLHAGLLSQLFGSHSSLR